MNNLRGQLIRLAQNHPELRKDILPLLKEAADKTIPENVRKPFLEASHAYQELEDAVAGVKDTKLKTLVSDIGGAFMKLDDYLNDD